MTTALALALGVALYAAAPWLAERAFQDPALLSPLRYAALTLPAATFMDATLAATRASRL